MKHKYYSLLLITVFLPFIFIACSGNGDDDSSEKIINVIAKQARKFTGNEAIAYSGTIEESEVTPLSFNLVGSVSRVLVSEGDYVKQGQLLAVLNDETYKNSYEMALASQKQAEDAYKRLLPMYKNGNLPEIKLVEVETGLQQAKSAAAIAKKNLDDCKLYSPVEGMVGKRSLEPGMSIIPGLSSISIVKIEKVFARVPVAENEISLIKKGQKALVNIGAINNETFTGIVEEIGIMADPIAHTYKIKIALQNRKGILKPGMICTAALDKIEKSDRLFVPSSSVLVDEQGKNFVYTVNQNKASRKYVKTGRLLTDGVEITDGLNEGELVVVTGQHKLVDNSSVNIVNK